MLLSMTGYGEARFQSDSLSVGIEVRAVNNRFLKVSLRASEPFHLLESEVEKVVRRNVRRGTIQVHLTCQRQHRPQDFQINQTALESYLKQLREISQKMGLLESDESLLPSLLTLPGVVAEPANSDLDLTQEWPVVERVLSNALDRLQVMRREEGKAMARELLAYQQSMRKELDKIEARTVEAVKGHRDRLLERVRTLLAESDAGVGPNDLIKEVSIIAERSDIAEEVVRLASHLEQFRDVVNEPESSGRKLEFLTQEMIRESNTIGSKASDVAISRNVVEIKGSLEKIRELIQNVE